MIYDLLGAIWFFSPAGWANVAPVLAKKTPGLKDWTAPIDGGRKWHGRRILGDNKTWRGLVCGVLIGMLLATLQLWLYQHVGFIRDISFFDYTETNVLALGGLLGFGALVGDSVESAFKRARGIKSGEVWLPYDQIDFVIGGMLASSLVVDLSLWQCLLVFLIWFLIHPLGTVTGYLLHLKDKPL